MIDWTKTLTTFGYNKPGYRKRLCVYCDICNTEGTILLARVADVVDGQLYWECKKCVAIRIAKTTKIACNTEEFKAGISARSKKLWDDAECRRAVLKNRPPLDKGKMSEIMKEVWRNPVKKQHHTDAMRRPETSQKLSTAAKKKWKNPEYRNKMINIFSVRASKLWANDDYRKKIIASLLGNPKLIAAGKRNWRDPIYIERMVELHKSLWNDPSYREKMIEIVKQRGKSPEWRTLLRCISIKMWQDPKYREEASRISSVNMIARWSDPVQRAKLIESLNTPEAQQKMALARLLMPRVSSIQTILYLILEDLNITHFREWPDKPADVECMIGPYVFDCVIPRPGQKTLLIECNGDYWHSLDRTIKNDTRKQSYIVNNLSDKYELRYLWEHEFLNKDRITETIKYWLGITTNELINYEFSEISIMEANASDYRQLLSKYHYLSTAPLGSKVYGAYYNNQLIATAAFSAVHRQNLCASIGYPNDQIRELSRFCIHPRYQKKNFGSWFLSRCMKLLPDQYKCIISYADETFNHSGGLYKACNFTLDKIVLPDYWYVANDGWVMHKKALYNHAVKMKLTEAEFAELHGYKKVYGNKKRRYKYVRQ